MRHLELIDKECETANRIISNLLEFTRPKRPQGQRINQRELVNTVYANLAEKQPIELACRFDPDPYEIIADSVQISQVFGNLITNAMQVMEAGGRLTIAASQSEGFHHIRFSDSGPGIPADHSHRIFEPLFTTKAKGTGLGLSICRQIIERHGGTIELCQPGEDGWACFHIRLPVEFVGLQDEMNE